jgi:hypothetical protein
MEDSQAVSAIELYRAQRRDTLTRAFLAQQQRGTAGLTPRALPRARVAFSLTLHWHDWETDLQTAEVSAGGCSFVAGREPAQDHLRFSLQLPSGAIVRGLGTVVACVPYGDRFYVCVRFDALTATAHAELADAVLETLLAQ